LIILQIALHCVYGVKHKRVVWLDWNGTLNVEICDFIAILIIVKVVTLCLFDLNVAQYADIEFFRLYIDHFRNCFYLT
jgi:hypothetical protein